MMILQLLGIDFLPSIRWISVYSSVVIANRRLKVSKSTCDTSTSPTSDALEYEKWLSYCMAFNLSDLSARQCFLCTLEAQYPDWYSSYSRCHADEILTSCEQKSIFWEEDGSCWEWKFARYSGFGNVRSPWWTNLCYLGSSITLSGVTWTFLQLEFMQGCLSLIVSKTFNIRLFCVLLLREILPESTHWSKIQKALSSESSQKWKLFMSNSWSTKQTWTLL